MWNQKYPVKSHSVRAPLAFDRDMQVNVILTNRIKERLGSGQFGFVERGVWRNGARDIQVAVKLLKEGASEIDKVKFLQEAAIMAQFRHPNVISLYGVVSKTEPVSLHEILAEL